MNDFTVRNNNLNESNLTSHNEALDTLSKSNSLNGKGHTFTTLKLEADNPITQLFLENPIETSIIDSQIQFSASVEALNIEEADFIRRYNQKLCLAK